MEGWELIELQPEWEVRHNGELHCTGSAKDAWSYVAGHAKDDTQIMMRYKGVARPAKLSGAALRALLAIVEFGKARE